MNDLAWLVLCLLLFAVVVVLTLRLRRASSLQVRPEIDPQGERVHSLQAPAEETVQILERMGEGVLLVDNDLTPVFSNSVARAMLGFQRTAVGERLPSEEIVSVARRALDDNESLDLLHLSFPRPIDLRVRATLLDGGIGVLVVLQDVTQEVLTQRVRREFVAHASHELKSPVAGLQTLAEAIEQAVRDDPTAVEHFSRRMVAEADRLGRLVGDLLDLSRLEDPTSLPTEPADLSGVGRKEIDGVRDNAVSKGVTLEGRIEPGIQINGDEQQLGLLTRNLLENAIRYTPDEGRVLLEIFRKGRDAFIRVTDDGIGIPREAHGRVFERFYRVDRARSRDMGGTGLGLAIVKHVAEMHGGSVSLSSDLGEGSIFTVRLPASAEDRAEESVPSLSR
jgi:signal transduction histidine kinase